MPSVQLQSKSVGNKGLTKSFKTAKNESDRGQRFQNQQLNQCSALLFFFLSLLFFLMPLMLVDILCVCCKKADLPKSCINYGCLLLWILFSHYACMNKVLNLCDTIACL